MKKYAPFLIVLAAALVVGCATPPPKQSPTEIDSHYVGMVERNARHLGTEVYWVNPPRRERRTEEDS